MLKTMLIAVILVVVAVLLLALGIFTHRRKPIADRHHCRSRH